MMKKVVSFSLVLTVLSGVFFFSASLIAKNEQVRHVVVFKYKPTATPARLSTGTR